MTRAIRTVHSDVDTPVSAYLKIRRGAHGFLFESVEGGERVGRYSFLGSGPSAVYTGRPGLLEERREGRVTRSAGDPLALLERRFPVGRAKPDGLPPFTGGLVGYLGYDAVRYVERLPRPPRDDAGVPDFIFGRYETVLSFDHVKHVITVIANGRDAADARRKADEVVRLLSRPSAPPVPLAVPARRASFTPNMTRAAFLRKVRRAKRYIKTGDIIQVVLSQRFVHPYAGDPFLLYRAMRGLNPSPYMFFVEAGDVTLAGSSPEMLVKVLYDTVETRPIAGTRPRGRTEREDVRLERELRADPKERAEHVMLVDLGRNDLGRVCRYGTVHVTDDMVVERYSHVMHLVSGVRGRLTPGRNAYDVLRAAFPAGTVSGAPKVRAMEIIDELEPTRRGAYAGAVGYIGYAGNMDTAIAFRMAVVKNGRAYMQAGMGIVADSVPEREYQESLAKARQAVLSVAAAEEAAS